MNQEISTLIENEEIMLLLKSVTAFIIIYVLYHFFYKNSEEKRRNDITIYPFQEKIKFGEYFVFKKDGKLILLGEKTLICKPETFSNALFVIDNSEKFGLSVPDKICVVIENQSIEGEYLQLYRIVRNFC